MDRYLRDGPLMGLPIHPWQHAFQAGMSTESALHQLVGRVERALDAGQYAFQSINQSTYISLVGAICHIGKVNRRRPWMAISGMT